MDQVWSSRPRPVHPSGLGAALGVGRRAGVVGRHLQGEPRDALQHRRRAPPGRSDLGWVTCTENILSHARGQVAVTSLLATNIFERVATATGSSSITTRPTSSGGGATGRRDRARDGEPHPPALRLGDARAHAILYGDPDVTRFLPVAPSRPIRVQARSERSLARFAEHWTAHGWGVWAVVDKATEGSSASAGSITCPTGRTWSSSTRCPAPRGAWPRDRGRPRRPRARVRIGGLERIVAVTRPEHRASRRVMERLGMATRSTATSSACASSATRSRARTGAGLGPRRRHSPRAAHSWGPHPSRTGRGELEAPSRGGAAGGMGPGDPPSARASARRAGRCGTQRVSPRAPWPRAPTPADARSMLALDLWIRRRGAPAAARINAIHDRVHGQSRRATELIRPARATRRTIPSFSRGSTRRSSTRSS